MKAEAYWRGVDDEQLVLLADDLPILPAVHQREVDVGLRRVGRARSVRVIDRGQLLTALLDLAHDPELVLGIEVVAERARLGVPRTVDGLGAVIDPADQPLIVTCRTGHQASQTWFLLTHLLGRKDVRWYDGSFKEWAARTDLPRELVKRGDVYALGVIAFEMLTGRQPFKIENTADMIAAHRGARPPLPSQVRPELTTAFDVPLLQALCFDPEQRTASPDSFRRALLEARESIKTSYSALRIIVADDDADFRSLATETLAYGFAGARIEAVADGEAALAACDREPAALAVIDLDMPGLNGVELTAALRANYSIPIVVVTASGGAPDWHLLSALGADGFLVKPIDPFALVALARKAVAAKKARGPGRR